MLTAFRCLLCSAVKQSANGRERWRYSSSTKLILVVGGGLWLKLQNDTRLEDDWVPDEDARFFPGFHP